MKAVVLFAASTLVLVPRMPTAGAPADSLSRGRDRAAVIASIDSLLNVPIKAGELAGASVGVVHGKDTLVLKGYGMADLELDVPTPPNATYEIGSVTKQFTAAAVMQLVDQGKVGLDDDITKYFPNYPLQGNKVTVRRLLDHTSGIKGYTEIPEFRTMSLAPGSRDSLMAIFSAKPFDFPAGEQETYNNSAFFLAGLLIEKVSGMSYGDYVEKNVFGPAGMSHSYYCDERKAKKNHAHGYDWDGKTKTLGLKSFISHTWPYAAGSLCSTAGDMVAWNQALHKGERVLKKDSYQELIAPATLNDGTKIRYSKGLALVNIAGRRAISHGGDIPGFASFSAYLPDDDLIVVILFNSEGPARPDDFAVKIADLVLGKTPSKAKTFSGDLTQYEGAYAGPGRGRPMTVTIGARDGKLAFKRTPADSGQLLEYLGNDSFSTGGMVASFDRDAGKVVRLRVDGGYGYNLLKKQ